MGLEVSVPRDEEADRGTGESVGGRSSVDSAVGLHSSAIELASSAVYALAFYEVLGTWIITRSLFLYIRKLQIFLECS